MAEIIQLKNRSTGEDQHPKTTTDAVSHNNTSLSSVLNAKQAKLIEGDNITLTPKADGTVEISGVSPTSVVDNLNSTSPTSALSANQGRVLDSKFADKQNNLVSGTNIKTINGQSVLGEGDITIEAESVDIVNNLTSDRTDAALAATQGKVLDAKITHLSSEVVVYSEGCKCNIPVSFINDWEVKAMGLGQYNHTTGYFELDEFTNITYEEAKEQIAIGNIKTGQLGAFNTKVARINLPFSNDDGSPHYGFLATYDGMSGNFNSVIQVWLFNGGRAPISLGGALFHYNLKLRRISGTLDLYRNATSVTFSNWMTKIEDFRFSKIVNFSAQWSSLINRESIRYMIDNKESSSASTFTLHQDAYDRLTQEDLDAATAKNITIVTP